jgi:hypothetical protein
MNAVPPFYSFPSESIAASTFGGDIGSSVDPLQTPVLA